jgi:hypothetical protein
LRGDSNEQIAGERLNMKILRVKISALGEITVDEHAASLAQLSASLVELKKVKSVVLYHRENPEGEPHPNAITVTNLVVQHRLPICFCVKPDFSDAGVNPVLSPQQPAEATVATKPWWKFW